MKSKSLAIILVQWILANMLGLFLCGLGFVSFYSKSGLKFSGILPLFQLFVWFVFGVIIALLQEIVLKRYFGQIKFGSWSMLTIIGWVMGSVLGMIVSSIVDYLLFFHGEGFFIVFGAVFGATIGFCQWFILKRQITNAEWWIAGSTFAWGIALAVSGDVIFSGETHLGLFAIGGFLNGLITGLTLLGITFTSRDPEPRSRKGKRITVKVRPLGLVAALSIVSLFVLGDLAHHWATHRGWTTYGVSDGLVNAGVTSIAVAPDGVLWFGTRGGVSRFDGETWTTYGVSDGLVNAGVTSITVAPDGGLWFGTIGGVSHFDGETWTTYRVSDGLVNAGVTSIAVAPDGVLWFGTRGGVSRFDGETWTTYTVDDGLVGEIVYYVAVTTDGVLWFGTNRGTSRFDGKTWTTPTVDDGLVWERIYSLDVSPDGVLWFGTDSGVSCFDGETWTIYTADDGLGRGSVSSIAVAPDGVLWFGTDNGVSRFDGETWTTYTTDNSGLPGIYNNVKSLTFDNQGQLWVKSNFLSTFDDNLAFSTQVLQVWTQLWSILRIWAIIIVALLVITSFIRFTQDPALTDNEILLK